MKLPLTLKQLLFLIFLLCSLSGIGSAYDPDHDGIDELFLSRCASITIRADEIAEEQEKEIAAISPAPLTESSAFHPQPAATIALKEPTSNLTPRAPPA